MSRRVADLHVDFLPGRYDRSKKALRAQVRKARRKGATITLHTEVAAKRRASALRHHDWTVLQGEVGTRRAESAITVHDATWEVLRWKVVRLGKDFGIRGPATAVIALLRHKATGRTLLISTAHLPAGVEIAWRFPTRRVVAHRTALSELRRIHRQWRRGHRPDAEVSYNDWNLSLFRRWVRRAINQAWPALKALPKRAMGKRGTHGSRLIDWPMIRRLFKVRFRVHALHPASDHRGSTLRGRIRPRRRRK